MATGKSNPRTSAQNLLAKLNIQIPPVSVEIIARHLGAVIKYRPFEGELSGFLFREGNQTIIGVNSSHSKTRHRFTIAHELGHLVLHEDDGLHVDRNFVIHRRDEVSSQAIDPIEIAANGFAAELLMPESMINNHLSDDEEVDYEDDKLIRSLASTYQVSLQAMIFRLTNLGIINTPQA